MIGIVRQVESFNESFSYKESSRERWGYLTTFTLEGKQVACFNSKPESASFGLPNQAALFTGTIADIVDGRLILTYCAAHDPKLATKTYANSPALHALEDAMICTNNFEPDEILIKLLQENYLDKSPINFDDGIPTFKVTKTLDIFGLPVQFIRGWDFFDSREKSLFARTPGTAPPRFLEIIFFPPINDAEKYKILKVIPDFDGIGRNFKNDYNSTSLYSSVGNHFSLRDIDQRIRTSLICSLDWTSTDRNMRAYK